MLYNLIYFLSVHAFCSSATWLSAGVQLRKVSEIPTTSWSARCDFQPTLSKIYNEQWSTMRLSLLHKSRESPTRTRLYKERVRRIVSLLLRHHEAQSTTRSPRSVSVLDDIKWNMSQSKVSWQLSTPVIVWIRIGDEFGRGQTSKSPNS